MFVLASPGSHHVQARRLDDVLERAARFDREANGATADGQARHAFRCLRREEQRGGGADVRADDVRRSQAPFIDQASEERPRAVRGDQLRATLIGVAESGQVESNHSPDFGDAIPDPAERPKALGPRRQQQHRDVRIGLCIREPDPHPVTDSEVCTDRRNRIGTHQTVSFLNFLRPILPTRTGGGRPAGAIALYF